MQQGWLQEINVALLDCHAMICHNTAACGEGHCLTTQTIGAPL